MPEFNFSETMIFKILLAATGGLGAFLVMMVERPKNLKEAAAAAISGIVCAYYLAAPITRYVPVLDVNEPDTVSAMGLIVGMMGIFIVQSVVAFAKGEQTPLGKVVSKGWSAWTSKPRKGDSDV